MTKSIYIISGLGVDERVFQRLDFKGYNPVFIKWIIPDKFETIENYAKRLMEQITAKRPILIGLSLGGMMSIEIAKQMDTEKVILLSSAKTKNEIPFYYRLAGKLWLHKLLRASQIKKSYFIINWFLGAESQFDKQLLKQILNDSNPIFVNWAIDIIVKWSNQTKLENIFHIHGTSDKTLPYRFVSCDYTVKNGGHLMVLNKADEISDILRQQIV